MHPKQRTLVDLLIDHWARDAALVACIQAALPNGSAIIWNHQGRVDYPQSGVLICWIGTTAGLLGLRILNDKTQHIVTVPLIYLDSAWLATIPFREPSA
jgi:hypothetical protein